MAQSRRRGWSILGGAEGNFELNGFRPALILADMCDHFRSFIVEGTPLDQDA